MNAPQLTHPPTTQGVRPAGLQKVASQDLAEFINVCISQRESRPRARQLLKHPYFDSIRRDKALAASRSDAALAAAGGGDGASDYGSATSGPVSRTTSSLADMLGSGGSHSHPTSARGEGPGLPALPGSGAPLGGLAPSAPGAGGLTGPPSVTSSSAHPLSRTVSAEAHSDRAASDSASIRSQRSNASELAQMVLENIAEEGEAVDNGEDGAAAAAAAARAGSLGPGSRQASTQATPLGSPPGGPSSPAKPPGSPAASSDGCRCDATERRFSVKGDWLEVDKRVQLRLRICEPSGG